MFQSSHKKKNDDLHAIFKEIPESEILIDDYSCALQKEILLHGRLYVTVEAAYFHSNLFVYETRVEIKWVDVTSINKSRTALVIPNAVEIHTQNNTKHGFSTLLSRDTTYTVMFKVWQNALMGRPQQSMELVRYARQLWRDSSRTGLTSEDSEQEENGVVGHSISDGFRKPKRRAPPPPLEGNKEPEVDDKREDVTGSSPVDQAHEEQLRGSEEKISPQDIPPGDGKELVNEEFKLPVDAVFEMIFTQSPFMAVIRRERKNSNIKVGEWTACQDQGTLKKRELSYVVALSYSIGPKSAETEEKQFLKSDSQPGLMYHILCEFVTKNIPYSESFLVVNQYCLWKVAPDRTHLRLNACVKYKKSCWGVTKSMIERGTFRGVSEFAEILKAHLHSAEASGVGRAAPTRSRRRSNPHVIAAYKRRLSGASNKRRQSIKAPPSRQSSRGSTASDITIVESPDSTTTTSRMVFWAFVFSVLFFLFAFNLFLYYRLSTFQASVVAVTSESNVDPGVILGRQQYFYMMEMERWKLIATMSVDVLSKINASLVAIKEQIGHHMKSK